MKWFLLMLVMGGGAAAFFQPWKPAEGATKTERKLIAVAAKHRDLSSFVLATGIVRPRVGAEVAAGSRVSGILSKLHCDVGSQVKSGELLAELDPTEFEAVCRNAEAVLENAIAERDYAHAFFNRQKKMGKTIVSADEIDLAERTYRVTKAKVKQAEASRQSAMIQLGYTKIVAPIAGVVASVSTQVGETVQASFSAPTFVTIIDLDRLEVWAYVDETDIGRIQVGQLSTFTVDTYMGTEFVGKVSAIYPKAEVRDNVVNYVVIIEVLEKHGKILRPEMTATVKIALEAGKDVLCVPNGAIRTDAEGAYVMMRDSSGGTVRRSVVLGFRGRGFTEIASGLADKERVLIEQ